MRTFPREQLIHYGVDLLTHKGIREEWARYIAEVAVDTEAMGITTHGLVMFLYLNEQIPKELDPTRDPILEKERGATALIDGNHGLGQVAMRMALELAEKKTRQYGVAMVGVRNSFWIGGAGPYLVPLARKGFFAQLWAQTSQCKDCAPFGGVEARFSTNPAAFAIPVDGDPIIADLSTSAISLGKVKQLARQQKKTPEPLFMDKEGNLSDDPNAVLQGGTILFLGGAHLGYKGFGMSLWAEALTAMAGGSANNPQMPMRQSFNLTVFDPQAFGGAEPYKREMKRFLAHVRSSRPRPGFTAVRLPGERAFQSQRETAANGIPVEDGILTRMNELAREHRFPEL